MSFIKDGVLQSNPSSSAAHRQHTGSPHSPITSRGQQDLLPNARAGFASRLIYTIVVKISSSQQEKRGDYELDQARALNQEFESVISHLDRDAIEQKIIQ
jgi:hypothetical protein